MIRLNRKRNIYMSWNRKSWFTCNDIFYETRKQTVHCYTGDHIKIATDYRVLVDLFVRYGGLSHGDWLKTYSFVEHAGLPVLILACGAVYETVAQGMIINAVVSTHSICSGARKPFHPVFRNRAFWKRTRFEKLKSDFLQNTTQFLWTSCLDSIRTLRKFITVYLVWFKVGILNSDLCQLII